MVAGAEMRRSITGCSVGGAERHVWRAAGIRQGADDTATQSDNLLRGWRRVPDGAAGHACGRTKLLGVRA